MCPARRRKSLNHHIGLSHKDLHVVLEHFPIERRRNQLTMRLPNVELGRNEAIAHPRLAEVVHEWLHHRVLVLQDDLDVIGIGEEDAEVRSEPGAERRFVLAREDVKSLVETWQMLNQLTRDNVNFKRI